MVAGAVVSEGVGSEPSSDRVLAASGVDPVPWTTQSRGLELRRRESTCHEGQHHPPDFRAEAVRLARVPGHSTREVARDLGIGNEALRRWVIQAEIDIGDAEGLTSDERAELVRLRRENRTLRTERAPRPRSRWRGPRDAEASTTELGREQRGDTLLATADAERDAVFPSVHCTGRPNSRNVRLKAGR
jgi:transposase